MTSRKTSLPQAVSGALHVFFGFGECCRFTPGCSEYCRDAFRIHGLLRGAMLSTRRLLRCHPWGAFGHDPVPSVSLTQGVINGQ